MELNINLLPQENRSKNILFKKPRLTIWFFLLGYLVISTGLLLWDVYSSNTKFEESKNVLEQKEQLKNKLKKLEELQKEQVKIENIIQTINNSFNPWVDYLILLEKTIPKEVWLNNVTGTEDNKMIIRGESKSYEGIVVFIDNLNQSGKFEKLIIEQIREKNDKENLNSKENNQQLFKTEVAEKLGEEQVDYNNFDSIKAEVNNSISENIYIFSVTCELKRSSK
ncbi:MAG TPA: PilN domain-containing protein [Clostridia bacterium]|jgi:Tfp pilus assembly protein PilN|nr:PilN domain-containing protein [Clostridia bacterium]